MAGSSGSFGISEEPSGEGAVTGSGSSNSVTVTTENGSGGNLEQRKNLKVPRRPQNALRLDSVDILNPDKLALHLPKQQAQAQAQDNTIAASSTTKTKTMAAERTISTGVKLFPPSSHTLPNAQNTKRDNVSPPTADWLTGTWQVTHSTLPMWKGKYGVKITYTPLPQTQETDANAAPDVNDLVEYQKAPGGEGKWSSVHGISKSTTVDTLGSGWAFSWRGRGWLMIASSQWEILGYGCDINGAAPGDDAADARKDWIVTYFSKTLFTPAGIDVYCRNPSGVSKECLEDIRAELGKLEDPGMRKLAGEVFEIPRK